MTHRLVVVYKCTKFHCKIFNGFQVIERTRFVTDRRTDGRTDRRTDARGKTICLPTLSGGDITTSSDFWVQEDQFKTNKLKTCYASRDYFLETAAFYRFLRYFLQRSHLFNMMNTSHVIQYNTCKEKHRIKKLSYFL